MIITLSGFHVTLIYFKLCFNFYIFHGMLFSRNFWVLYVTFLRMLKVCFPLKERVLVDKKIIRNCFIIFCVLGLIFPTFETLNVRKVYFVILCFLLQNTLAL